VEQAFIMQPHLRVAVVAVSGLLAATLLLLRQRALVVLGPQGTASAQRHQTMVVVVVEAHQVRPLLSGVPALAVAVRLQHRQRIGRGRAVYPTLVLVVAVVTGQRVAMVPRALSSSDTRWPHNG
jgi:hypothetical protein